MLLRFLWFMKKSTIPTMWSNVPITSWQSVGKVIATQGAATQNFPTPHKGENDDKQRFSLIWERRSRRTTSDPRSCFSSDDEDCFEATGCTSAWVDLEGPRCGQTAYSSFMRQVWEVLHLDASNRLQLHGYEAAVMFRSVLSTHGALTVAMSMALLEDSVWNIVHDCMVSTFPWRAGMDIFCMLWISWCDRSWGTAFTGVDVVCIWYNLQCCASSFFSRQVFSSKKVLVFGAMEDAVPAAPSLPPAAPSLPSKIQELKQRKAQLTAARKAAAKELKAKERQMTRLRKHLQKLKPSDLAELVTLAPAVKAKAKAKAKARA